MLYFGVYKHFNNINNPENYVDNYEFILKVEKVENNVFNNIFNNIFNIVEVLHTNSIFDITNYEMFINSFKTFTFSNNMFLVLDDNNNIINISYQGKNAYDFRLYYSHNNSKNIFLESLDKIKENIIKHNKILSE
jgi:hypothetical protein